MADTSGLLNGNGNTVKALAGIAIACIGLLGGAYAAHADMVKEVTALREKVAAHDKQLDSVKDEVKETRREITVQGDKTRKAIWELADRVAELTTKVAVESASHRGRRGR